MIGILLLLYVVERVVGTAKFHVLCVLLINCSTINTTGGSTATGRIDKYFLWQYWHQEAPERLLLGFCSFQGPAQTIEKIKLQTKTKKENEEQSHDE